MAQTASRSTQQCGPHWTNAEADAENCPFSCELKRHRACFPCLKGKAVADTLPFSRGHMPRLTKWQWVILWAGLVLGVSATAFGWRVFTALRISRQEVRAANSIDVVVGPYTPSAKRRFEAVSAPTEFRRAAIFQNHLYMAGKEGLLEYDSAGAVVRQFSVGAELPS